MDDIASEHRRARRLRVGLALGLVGGIVMFGAVVALRPTPRPWVVDFVIENPGLGYEDPCTAARAVTTGGYITGGGAYGGLLTTSTKADAESVGACYEAHGATVEVRRQTDDDADRINEVSG